MVFSSLVRGLPLCAVFINQREVLYKIGASHALPRKRSHLVFRIENQALSWRKTIDTIENFSNESAFGMKLELAVEKYHN